MFPLVIRARPAWSVGGESEGFYFARADVESASRQGSESNEEMAFLPCRDASKDGQTPAACLAGWLRVEFGLAAGNIYPT